MVHKFHFPTARSDSQLLKQLRGSLISVAGLVGREIVNQEGQTLGSIVDLVCRWDADETYPPLTGIIARVAYRRVWIPASNINQVSALRIQLNSAKMDLREFMPRSGEVRLHTEVLDHQLIDFDGARVVRASDLYIASVSGKTRLVGVDVGMKPLLRRLGPKKYRTKAVPDAVIDWGTIQSFGSQKDGKQELRLSANRNELRRMRPGELADLLEDLGRSERKELLNVLTPDLAADALEEMEAKELESLLRESSAEEGAEYLSNMEPDEAADALRDLDESSRDELLAQMSRERSNKLKKVLNYDEETAGGIMNISIFTAQSHTNVSEVKLKLKNSDTDINSLNAIAIIDKSGKLLYDLPLIELLTASDDAKLENLMKPPSTVTVLPDAPLEEVAELLIEGRGSSIVVTDKKDKPLGRIMADDLLDAILPSGRFHFPRLLS
jgi:CBS domain-containing protein